MATPHEGVEPFPVGALLIFGLALSVLLVLFGMLYGEAKCLAVRGHHIGSALCVVVGFALSALLHGLYDATATLADYGDGTFLLVVALIYVIVFLVVRSAAKHDKRFA